MKIEEVLEKNKKILKKSFVDSVGEVYFTNKLHEMLAMEICEQKGWDWYNYCELATDYLIQQKAFIKIANYEECEGEYHYVAFATKLKKAKRIRKTANFIADVLKVPIIYEEET